MENNEAIVNETVDMIEATDGSGATGLIVAGAIGVGVLTTLLVQKGWAWFKARKEANDYVVDVNKNSEGNEEDINK